MKIRTLQFGKALSAALFVLLLSVVGMMKGYAYDFSAVCSTGQTLYYNITDADNHYVELTCPGTPNIYNSSMSWQGFTKPTGNIILPGSVQNDGVVYTVTSISSYAFYECHDLTGSLTIPNSVISIGDYAFTNCYFHEGELIIGSSVTTIGEWAFLNGGFDGDLIIPNSVTYIGDGAFSWCFYGELVISNSITSIGNFVFEWCGTGDLIIPNSVISIGEGAFYNCGFTGNLTIPNSVTTIGYAAFHGCDNFMGSLTIGNSVSTIGDSAFEYCSGFTGELIIPNSVTAIGESAFDGCSGFTGNLTIGNSVTTIGYSAFEYCSGFTGELIIPNSVTSIGDNAFYECSGFTGLRIGNAVETIGDYAFYMFEGSGITTMVVFPETPPELGSDAFYGVSKDIPVEIPMGSLDAYMNAPGWNEFTGLFEKTMRFTTYVDNDIYPMNTAIPIHGTVTDFENTPIANMEVEIGITVMDWKRTLTAISDESGQFSATFEPLPLESGYYTVNSGPVGNTSTEVQDSFDILGMDVFEQTLDDEMTIVNSQWLLCDVVQDVPKTGYISIRNRNSFTLTNIQVAVLSAPEGAQFTFMPLTLAGLEDGYLEYTALGTTRTQGNEYQQVRLKVTCDQGTEALFTIWFYCQEAQGILEISPTALNTTMTKGLSKTIDVTLNNNGEAATGEITVNLPNQEWMSVVGGRLLPSIEANESATFTLRLSPDQNVPLGQFLGNIVISCEHGESVSLPYSIMAVSEANGALVVDVTDEFTTNTNNGNGPHVEGAEVTLTDYYSHETVAHGFTAADGTFSVENLTEGYYILNVNEDRHKGYGSTISIDAGVTKQMNVFLQYHGVNYSWVVEPTEIPDEYTIVLDLEYEVEVPVPVVTIEAPQRIPVFNDAYTFNYSITNHGLIDAVNITLYVPENEYCLFTPLYDHIDTLHAHATVEIPCVVTRKNTDPIECGEWCMTNLRYGYLSGEEMMYDYAMAYSLLGNTVPCSQVLPPLSIEDEGGGNEGGGGGASGTTGYTGGHGAPTHPSYEEEEVYGNYSTPMVNNQIPTVDVRVGVRFSQSQTMTREAFIGTFAVHNGHETNAMTGIGLDFVIKDGQGNDRTDLFQISTQSLTGVTAIDGEGILAGGADGVVKILFIPTKEAAPTEPVNYYFGGTFTFNDPWNSVTRVMNLYPTCLTVHPSPDLYIDYFVAHNVYGDNPLTPEIEPIIPVELAVRIWNKGAGTAKNVTLETAKPVIASNIQNLLIDFDLYGTYIQGQGVQVGLTGINFGNIESGQTKVGEWLFTSSLLAHLVSYDANVIHDNSYGHPTLSLISHLGIHELVHPIHTFGARTGGINDFLVNDIPDENKYPDSIYFSNGGKTSVGVVENMIFDKYVMAHDTIVTLTVNPSRIGWNYGETEDPGRNHYELLSCVRNNDNQVIPLSNIWQEAMLVPNSGDSLYENKLRIVDTVSVIQTYTYTLVFAGDPNAPYVFFGDDDEYWSNAANWESFAKPQNANCNVLIDGICQLDEDVNVSTLSIMEGKSLTIPEDRILTVSNSLENTVATGLVIEDGGQLMHANAGVHATVRKAIAPYTNNNNGWDLLASPLVGNTDVASVTNLLNNNYDLYYYDEPTHYWMNQEDASNNFTNLVNGKGYLYANNQEVILEFSGELESGLATINVPLNYTESIGTLKGFNLVGNPFVHDVVSCANANVTNGCFVMNEAKDDLTVSEIDETNPLKPAEGFFVKATGENASITFNSGRGETANRSGSIRVELMDNGKHIDRLIVKMDGEPLEKMSLKEQRTKLFAMQDHQEVAIVPIEGNEQPINFKAAKNGTYTLNVNVDNLEFDYLHLIDNLTGADVDLLAKPTYSFDASPSDYSSRFLLRFIMHESNVSETENFAFFFNNKLVIINEGNAILQVVDLLGHFLSSEKIIGTYEKQINAAPGVYMIRLLNGNNVKTQKVIKR